MFVCGQNQILFIGIATANATYDDEPLDEHDELSQLDNDEEINENDSGDVGTDNEDIVATQPRRACNCDSSSIDEDEATVVEDEEEEIVAPSKPAKPVKTACRVKSEQEKLSKVVRKLGKGKLKKKQLEEEQTTDEGADEATNEEEEVAAEPVKVNKKNTKYEKGATGGKTTRGNRIDAKSRVKRDQKTPANGKERKVKAVKSQKTKKNTKTFARKAANVKKTRGGSGKRIKSTKSEL